jgi:hypothetical protein
MGQENGVRSAGGGSKRGVHLVCLWREAEQAAAPSQSWKNSEGNVYRAGGGKRDVCLHTWCEVEQVSNSRTHVGGSKRGADWYAWCVNEQAAVPEVYKNNYAKYCYAKVMLRVVC